MSREFRYPLAIPTPDVAFMDPDTGQMSDQWRQFFEALVLQAGGQGSDMVYEQFVSAATVDELAILRQQNSDLEGRLAELEARINTQDVQLSTDTIIANLEGNGITVASLEVTDSSSIAGAVPETRVVGTGTGLTGGGDLTANRTISIDSAASVTFGNMNTTGAYSVDGTQVVTNQQTSPTTVSVTYSANDPGITPDQSVTIADGSAPTPSELLEYIVEVHDYADNITAVLEAHGLSA